MYRIDRPEDVIKELGCDYITLTASNRPEIGSLHSVASELFRNQSALGNKHRSWALRGYKGFACGEVEIGTREDSLIVRTRGSVSHASWTTLLDHADNCSRFDVQVTVEVMDHVQKRIDRIRRAAERHSAKHNAKPVVRWVREFNGGYTLYLGARESNVFARIYDKFHHSKLDHYRQCVRIECQFQDAAARIVAKQCRATVPQVSTMAGCIRRFLAGRDLHLEIAGASKTRYSCPRSRSDSDRKLKWLAEAVRPTVQFLKDKGLLDDTLQALGLLDQ